MNKIEKIEHENLAHEFYVIARKAFEIADNNFKVAGEDRERAREIMLNAADFFADDVVKRWHANADKDALIAKDKLNEL